jgi:glycosyltransferase involved in cell wall biosynthesis
MEEYSRVMNYEATILIPFLKPDVFFMKAISSIRKSLLIDMEILLIGPADLNKGEKLFVSEICEKSQLDFRVIFASTSNVAQALNIGLKNIETEFIIRFDSDDIMLPSRIPNQLSYLKQNPDVVVVGGQISLISKSGLPVIWPRIH